MASARAPTGDVATDKETYVCVWRPSRPQVNRKPLGGGAMTSERKLMPARRPGGRALQRSALARADSVPRAEYRVRAVVWLYPGKGGWHFAALSPKQSSEIRARFGTDAKGWGSLPVSVRIGATEWTTSLFPDKKSRCYLFAIKAEVRQKEHIIAGNAITAVVGIR